MANNKARARQKCSNLLSTSDLLAQKSGWREGMIGKTEKPPGSENAGDLAYSPFLIRPVVERHARQNYLDGFTGERKSLRRCNGKRRA